MKVIGLTGGIGSGKSLAAKVLAALGADVIDADRVGHAVYEPGTLGWQRVVAEFGNDIVADNGMIDRQRLGAIVFSDPARLADLNRIVHPLIAAAIREQIEARRRSAPERPIVVEAAVLIEANWRPLVDELWVVVANRERVVERVAAQRNLDRSAIEARMNAQLSDAERRAHADVVVENDGSVEALERRLERVWRERVASGRQTRLRPDR